MRTITPLRAVSQRNWLTLGYVLVLLGSPSHFSPLGLARCVAINIKSRWRHPVQATQWCERRYRLRQPTTLWSGTLTPGNNDKENKAQIRQTTSRLHPRVYARIVGLVGWLIVSVWIFAGAGPTDYLLVIVSGFIFIAAVGLPFILSRQLPQGGRDQPSFRTWRSWDFETWSGRLSGRQAAAQILLPIAAVAFGMTAFGIVLRLVELTST